MPKAKRQKTNTPSNPHPKHHDRRKSSKPQTEKKPTKSTTASKPSSNSGATKTSNGKPPVIPFDVFDNILLVGEGDLSFTLSLLHDHGCASLVSTTFDTLPALLEKYPHVPAAIQQIKDEDQTVLHGVDATKLGSHKELRKRAPFGRVFFNFPHVGGASTDVNRQVRANQALLAAFFAAAIPLLSAAGSVLVTLFEAEPYTLWNVRDLARSAGLVVRRSWRFEREMYPLYRHARTLGVVKSKSGEASETAWKGEERVARTYEFGLKDGEDVAQHSRKRRTESSDDEIDDP